MPRPKLNFDQFYAFPITVCRGTERIPVSDVVASQMSLKSGQSITDRQHFTILQMEFIAQLVRIRLTAIANSGRKSRIPEG